MPGSSVRSCGFRFLWLGKKRKDLILRYIEQLSGYSRQHVTRLVKEYGETGLKWSDDCGDLEKGEYTS
jgi:hypothetical protein